jgi:type I restriction enzyme S subunit
VADVRWGDTSTTKASYTPTGFRAFSASGPDGFLSRYDYDRTGIVLSAIGSDCGKVWLAKGRWSCIKNTIRIFSSDPQVRTEYLFWLTSRDGFFPRRGSGQPFISQGDARDCRVLIPDLKTQDAICELLGALDDKIELNRRMNETLEAMAQAIFRDWFVDFGPVRRKLAGETDPVAIMGGLTPDPARAAELAALFPAAFEEAGPPQGWKVATLTELAAHWKGSINPLAHPNVEFEHYSLPAFDSGQEPVIDYGSDIKSNKTPVPEGAVLLSKLNPEIPRIWLPNPPSGRQQIASTEFLIFLPAPGIDRGLLYCLFRDPTFRQVLAGMVTGTSKSHQRISPPALMKSPLLIGSGEAFGAFGEFAEPLLERALSLRAENRTLAETRDYLLPRLMSGQVRVGDLEQAAA